MHEGLVPRMIVPAVTEVCRPQSAHSDVKALLFSSQTRPRRSPGRQPVWPTPLEKIPRARVFHRKAALELDQR
jgi:hypothetical protein